YIAQQKSSTSFDPILVAAAYNAGSVLNQTSVNNRWRLRQYPIGTAEHCNRFLKWFNDFWAIVEELDSRPVLSFHAHFHQCPAVFPVPLGGDSALSARTLARYYKHTEVEHSGGYFPLGANSVWHG